MWLVVGLGNPGRKYARTRHNVGFRVLEAFAEGRGLQFREADDVRSCRVPLAEGDAVLIEPMTYMNRSGAAVRRAADRFAVPPQRIIVVHDDLDMTTGKVRIRRTGSSGGHRGVESVIHQIGSREFVRIKIGIGRDPEVPAEEHVLRTFRPEERPLIEEAVAVAVDAIALILREGVEKAMNTFN